MRSHAPHMSGSSTRKACIACKKNREKELRMDVKEDENRIQPTLKGMLSSSNDTYLMASNIPLGDFFPCYLTSNEQ